MRGKACPDHKKLAVILALILSPVVFVGVPLRTAFSEWFIDWEYSKPDFPEDPYGMDREYRKYLAKLGLRAVLSDEGMAEFRKAKLPDGRRAFNPREIKHMEDVKELLSVVFPIIYLSVPLFLGSLLFTRSLATIGKVLIFGSLITLILMAAVLTFSVINYDLAFEMFHNYLFDPYSWRFQPTDTLLRIYPMKFWYDGTILVILSSIAFSLISITLGSVLLYFSWTSRKE